MVLSVVLYKQKTAYELRMSDWSSDVCSSDLSAWPATFPWPARRWRRRRWRGCAWPHVGQARMAKPREDPALDDLRTRRWPSLEECGAAPGALSSRDRKSVVSGKRVSVRLDLGASRVRQKKTIYHANKL